MSQFIHSLTLEGYKCFRGRTKLILGSSLTVVVGQNGSGKSAIVDALRCVWGRPEGDKGITQGLDFGFIVAETGLVSSRYVVRILRRGEPSTLHVTNDIQPFLADPHRTFHKSKSISHKNMVGALLAEGMDIRQLDRLVVSQGQRLKHVRGGPLELCSFFDSLAGTDTLRMDADAMVVRLSELHETLTALEASIEVVKAKERSVEGSSKEVLNFREKVERSTEEGERMMKSSKEDMEKIKERELKKMEKARSRIGNLEVDIREVQDDLDTSKRGVEKIKEENARNAEAYKKLESEARLKVDMCKARLEGLMYEVSKIKNRKSKLTSSIKKNRKRISELEVLLKGASSKKPLEDIPDLARHYAEMEEAMEWNLDIEKRAAEMDKEIEQIKNIEGRRAELLEERKRLDHSRRDIKDRIRRAPRGDCMHPWMSQISKIDIPGFHGALKDLGTLGKAEDAAAVHAAIGGSLRSTVVVDTRGTALEVVDAFTRSRVGTVTCLILDELDRRNVPCPKNSLRKCINASAGFEEVWDAVCGDWILVDVVEGRTRENRVTKMGDIYRADGEIRPSSRSTGEWWGMDAKGRTMDVEKEKAELQKLESKINKLDEDIPPSMSQKLLSLGHQRTSMSQKKIVSRIPVREEWDPSIVAAVDFLRHETELAQLVKERSECVKRLETDEAAIGLLVAPDPSAAKTELEESESVLSNVPKVDSEELDSATKHVRSVEKKIGKLRKLVEEGEAQIGEGQRLINSAMEKYINSENDLREWEELKNRLWNEDADSVFNKILLHYPRPSCEPISRVEAEALWDIVSIPAAQEHMRYLEEEGGLETEIGETKIRIEDLNVQIRNTKNQRHDILTHLINNVNTKMGHFYSRLSYGGACALVPNLLTNEGVSLKAKTHPEGVWKPFQELSGGQQAQVTASLTLGTIEGGFVLFDEIDASLDTSAREVLADILEETPGTVAVISHSPCVMLKGKELIGVYAHADGSMVQPFKMR